MFCFPSSPVAVFPELSACLLFLRFTPVACFIFPRFKAVACFRFPSFTPVAVFPYTALAACLLFPRFTPVAVFPYAGCMFLLPAFSSGCIFSFPALYTGCMFFPARRWLYVFVSRALHRLQFPLAVLIYDSNCKPLE